MCVYLSTNYEGPNRCNFLSLFYASFVLMTSRVMDKVKERERKKVTERERDRETERERQRETERGK